VASAPLDTFGNVSRAQIFFLEVVYLLVLACVFVAWTTWPGFRHALPSKLGELPIGVPWFGAAGATLISLTGVFKHSQDWDDHFALWHYSRPLVGAFLGSVGALLFLVIVQTAAIRPQRTNAGVYYVVAFLIGYREATFRSLIQRATDLLLSPSGKSSPPDRPHLGVTSDANAGSEHESNGT
jgi:hypothetical protein